MDYALENVSRGQDEKYWLDAMIWLKFLLGSAVKLVEDKRGKTSFYFYKRTIAYGVLSY